MLKNISNTIHYKRQIPVNIGSFGELVKKVDGERYFEFVDKTEVIRLLIPERSPAETRKDPGQSMLIIRPRRWGKTLFMSMVEAFFSNTAQGRELFRGLAIESLENGRYMVEQGQYPVIFLSLRDVAEKTFESFLIKIDLAIKNLYEKYEATLSNSSLLTSNDKAYVTRVTRARLIPEDSLSKEVLENSLKELSRLLSKHFSEINNKKKVFILIDEYDAPLNSIYQDNLLLEKISDFMKNMLGAALKDNEYLRKGIMTGILRLSQSNMLSQLNNLVVYTARSDKFFAPYFGFTDEEVGNLIKNSGANQHSLDDIKSFYNGYYLEGCTIYNPWAINNYLASGRLKPYWVNSGGDKLLSDLLKEIPLAVKKVLQNLLEGKISNVSVDTEDRVQFSELKKDTTAFWSYLLSTGYLTITPEKVVSTSYSSAGERYSVRIPNEEIRHRFCTLFAKIMEEDFHISDEENTHFIEMLFTGDTIGFANQLSIYLASCASYHDFPRESNYHTFMLGLVAHLRNDYFIPSNTEAGDGRADLIFIPKDIKKSEALIIELKHVKEEKLFKREAKMAIEQINNKRYAANVLQFNHIQTVHCIGIVFHKKKSHVLAGKTFEVEKLFPGSRKKRAFSITDNRDVDSGIANSSLKTVSEDNATLKKSHHPHEKESVSSFSSSVFLEDFNAWYDDNNINTLLRYYYQHDNNMDDVRVLDVLPLEGNITHQLIYDRLMDDFDNGVSTYYLPLRINANHWIGLYIDRSAGNPQAWWIDPYGGISSARQNEIVAILNQTGLFDIPLTQENVHFQKHPLQQDGYNCGPWVIEIFRFMRRCGRFPKPQTIDINACRKEHHQILENNRSHNCILDSAISPAPLSDNLSSLFNSNSNQLQNDQANKKPKF